MNVYLGEAVKIARTIAKESQSTFSKSFGIAQQTIGEWEATGKVPEKHWPKLLDKYKVDARAYITNTISGDVNGTANQSQNMTINNQLGGDKLTHTESTLINLIRTKQNPEVMVLDFIVEAHKRD